MNNQDQRRHSHPYLGVGMAMFLVFLAFRLVPYDDHVPPPDIPMTPLLRIDALDDSSLAGQTRTLPVQFIKDLTLDAKAGEPFNEQWKSYSFLGEQTLGPRLPDDVILDLKNQTDLNDKQLGRLLDEILRNKSVSEAVAGLEAYLQNHPLDYRIRDFAASFYLERLMPEKAVGEQKVRFSLLLDQIKAASIKKEKIELAGQAQGAITEIDSIGKAYLLGESTGEMMMRLIEACPELPDLLFDYLEILLREKKYEQAQKLLAQSEKSLTNKTLQVVRYKTRILEKLGKTDEAIALYDGHDGLFTKGLMPDFVDLLQRTHRLETWRGNLMDRLESTLDMTALEKLLAYFNLKSSDHQIARQLEIAQKHAKTSGISKENLYRLAELTVKYGRESSRSQAPLFFWNLLLLSKTDAEKMLVQADLAQALSVSDTAAPIPVNQAMPSAAALLFTDRYPGVVGGLLSLDLNMRGTGERFAKIPNAAIRYENMALALKLALPLVDENVPENVADKAARCAYGIFLKLDDRENYAKTITAFLNAQPNAESLPDYLWLLADHYRYLKLFDDEIAQYEKIVALATTRNEKAPLIRARKRIVNRYLEEKMLDKVIPFYWSQINRNLDDETLLREFLDFCKANNIFEESVKAYELGARQFDTMDYTDKLARYLLTQKKRETFEQLTKNIVSVLGETDLGTYINQHLFSKRFHTIYAKWDSQERGFYEQVYVAALSRFPDNREFLDGLLELYGRFEKKIPEAKSKRIGWLVRYFGTDDHLADDLCSELSSLDKLRAAVDEVQKEKVLNPVQMRFLVRALGYLSQYEAQYSVAKILGKTFPEVDLTLTVASLERSLDSSFYVEDENMTLSSSERYAHLGELYPTNYTYPTHAGEALVEAGKRKSAAEQWEKMLAVEPGLETSYLELSTLYWDYYLFNNSLGVIYQSRKTLDAPLMLAKEAAYIYESMGRKDLAIDEYVRVICRSGNDRWEVEERLNYFKQKKQFAQKVDDAFRIYLDRVDATAKEVLAYGDFLGTYGKQKEKTEMFMRYLPRFEDEIFLLRLSDYFGGQGKSEPALRALDKLANVTDRSTDVLLRLLAFHCAAQNKNDLEKIGNELLKTNGPGTFRHEDVLFKVFNALWDAGYTDPALTLEKTYADLAKGYEKDSRSFEYAKRCLLAKVPLQGMEILGALYQKHPSRTDYLIPLAEYYSEKKQYDALASLYDKALSDVAKASLPKDQKDDLVEEHRRNLITSLVKLKRFSKATDHYIEILNRAAPDKAVTDQVYEFAQSYGQTDRLIRYYEKLAEKSDKNFRWQEILGNFYDRLGKLDIAITAFEKAIVNEPSRLELYTELVKAQKRKGDLQAALTTLERKYELSGTASDLQALAEFAFTAGQRERAIEILDQIADQPNATKWRLLDVARIFLQNKEIGKSGAIADRIINDFLGEPIKKTINGSEFETVSKILVARDGYVRSLTTMQDLAARLRLESQKEIGLVKNNLIKSADRLEYTIAHSLAKDLYEKGTPQEIETTQQVLIDRTHSELTQPNLIQFGKDHFDSTLRFYLNFAQTAHMPALKMELMAQRNKAFVYFRGKDKTRSFYQTSVMQMLGEYSRLDDQIGALKTLLENSFASDYPNLYYEILARQAFVTGDETTLNSALANYFNRMKDLNFSLPNVMMRKYLDGLTQNDRDKLKQLASGTTNPSALVFWATLKNEKQIAMSALSAHFGNKPQSWHLRRKIQICEYLNDNACAKTAYQSILGLPRTIGNKSKVILDKNTELTQGRWYDWAKKYGTLLLSENDDAYRDFLYAGIEDHPLSAEAYLTLAEILAEHKHYDEAFENIALAKALSPGGKTAIELTGRVYLKMGELKKARETFEQIINRENVGVYDYRTYYELMKEGKMGDAALKLYGRFVIDHFSGFGYYTKKDEIKNIVDEYDNLDSALLFLRALCRQNSNDITVFNLIINDKLIPENEKGWFIQAAADMVKATSRYMPDFKKEWQAKVILYAIAQKDAELGQRAFDALHEIDPSSANDPFYKKQKAHLMLAGGNAGQGEQEIMALADVCPNEECYTQLEQIALQENQKRIADKIRMLAFDTLIRNQRDSISDRIDYAKLLFAFGEIDKGASQLEYAASVAGDRPGQYEKIARVYLEAGQVIPAKKHIETARKLAPENGRILVTAAVTLAFEDQYKQGVELLQDASAGSKVSRSDVEELIRWTTAVLKKTDRAEPFSQALSQVSCEIPAFVRAGIHLDNNQGEKARQTLIALSEPIHFKEMFTLLLAKAYRAQNNLSTCKEILDQAIFLMPDRKELLADRFFVLMELNQPARALDSLGRTLPTDRFYLNETSSKHADKYGVRNFPNQLELSKTKGNDLLEKTAEALLELGFKAEARTYLEILSERIEATSRKVELEGRIRELTREIKSVSDSTKPWPVITSEL